MQNLMKHDCPFGKFPSPKSFILRVALKSKLSSLLKSFRTVYFMRFYICAYNNSKVNPIQTHLGHLITQLSSTSNISMNCPIAYSNSKVNLIPNTSRSFNSSTFFNTYELPSRGSNDQICCLIRFFPPPACN